MAETKAKADRRADAKSVLGDHEVGPAKFVELCWTFPEIDQIDLYRITGTGMNKLPQLLTKDFPPAEVESYLLNTLGPGKYRLSPMWRPDGKYVTSRTWGFGEFKEENPLGSARAVSEPSNGSSPIDMTAVTKALTDELKGMGLLEQWKGFVLEKQAAAATREMQPVKILADIVTGMLAAKAQAKDTSDPEIESLKKEVQDLRRQQIEALMRKVEDLEKKLASPVQPTTPTGIAEISHQVKTVGEAAALLGYTKGPGAPAVDVWTGLAKLGEALGPTLERGLSIVERVVNQKITDPAVAAVTGGPAVAQPIELPQPVKDAIAMTVESLRIRDYDTVLHMLTSVLVKPDGTPFVILNPKVNPLAYILQMKPLVPEIDGLRAEFSEFLKWFGDQVEEAKAEAVKAPTS